MAQDFQLHPQLAADCIQIGHLSLSMLLLLNDARYPWFVLVPRCAPVTEIFELSEDDQRQLWRESAQLSKFIKHAFHADKINIGALGNLVPQLHVHHVARFRNEAASRWFTAPGQTEAVIWGEFYDQVRQVGNGLDRRPAGRRPGRRGHRRRRRRGANQDVEREGPLDEPHELEPRG